MYLDRSEIKFEKVVFIIFWRNKMIVPCIQEFQEANEQVRKIHEEMYNSARSEGIIWDSIDCEENGCIYFRRGSNVRCLASRCVHDKNSWEGCRIPFMDYCSTTNYENPDNPIQHIQPKQNSDEVKELIRVEFRKDGYEIHTTTVKVESETENCYILKDGSYVYKKNGEKRNSCGKNNNYGKIRVRYYPPTEIDNLEDCPKCGKSIFFPFIIKKEEGAMFNPICKICPHCNHEIPINEGTNA